MSRYRRFPLLRRDRSSNFRYDRLFVLLLLILIAVPLCLYAQAPSKKEEVLKHYEEAISLAEELNVYQEDVFNIVPKIRLAGNELLRDNLDKADAVLKETLADLEMLKTKRPPAVKRELRLEWLEIFFEIFQKYVMLLLLAYFFVKWPYFNRMIQNNRLTFFGKLYFAFLMTGVSIVLSLFDLSRYGESAWAFFDIQFVLVILSGLLGGLEGGAVAGICIGIYRILLNPAFVIYAAIAFTAGVTSGLASRKIVDFQKCRKFGFYTGCVLGLFHSLAVYLPMQNLIPWYYFLLTIVMISAIEGGGVLAFLGVVSGIMRDQNRRQMENDLLKTKLLFLQAQMSPHFLFNALNTISSICVRENALQAQKLVLRLAEFLRGTLKREDEKVNLRDEIAYIDSYLEIEKARFQERLNVEKNLELADEEWEVKIPLLILQPLVENAVRHGIGKKETGGTVKIRAFRRDREIVIEISDDGVGMESATASFLLEEQRSRSEGLGIGVKNIHQRLLRLYGPSYGLQYESVKGQGTKVTVRIPIEEKKKS